MSVDIYEAQENWHVHHNIITITSQMDLFFWIWIAVRGQNDGNGQIKIHTIYEIITESDILF